MTIKHLNTIVFIVTMLITTNNFLAWAQNKPKDTPPPIKQEEVDIVKPYEPVLADAVKLEFSPDLPSQEDLDKKKFRIGLSDYDVPNRFLTIAYSAPQLKPLAYKGKEKGKKGSDEDEDDYHFWLRGGYGNFNTPLLEVSATTGKSDRFLLGGHGSYISSNGPLAFQNYSQAKANVFGKFFLPKDYVQLGLTYRRNNYFYYGFNQEDTLFTPIEDSLKIVYNDIAFSAEFGNTTENERTLDYQALLKYHYYFNAFGLTPKENNILLDGKVNKRMGDHWELGGFSQLHFSNYKNEIDSTDTDVLFNVTPFATYRAFFGALSGGVSLLLNHDKFLAYPYINVDFFIIPETFTLYGGLNKKLIKNNYFTLSEENPYIADYIPFQNTQQENRFVGAKGSIGKRVTYNVQGFQRINKHQALFINIPTDTMRFTAAYDSSMTAIGGMAEIGFEVSKKVTTRLGFTFQGYDTQNEAEAWHLPTVQVNLRADVFPIEKLQITGDIFVLQGAKGRLPDGTSTNLKGAVDINLAAHYQLMKHVSLFAHLNNIASIKSDRFLYYPTYGFNALGGATIRF